MVFRLGRKNELSLSQKPYMEYPIRIIVKTILLELSSVIFSQLIIISIIAVISIVSISFVEYNRKSI